MSNLEANRLELRGDLSELGRLPRWIKARAPEELSADTSFAVQLASRKLSPTSLCTVVQKTIIWR